MQPTPDRLASIAESANVRRWRGCRNRWSNDRLNAELAERFDRNRNGGTDRLMADIQRQASTFNGRDSE